MMMKYNFKKSLIVSALVCLSTSIYSQESTHSFEKHIDSSDLYTHVSILASDSLQGRNTGENGQKMAAEYIQSVFTKHGISVAPGMTSYKQVFDLYTKTKSGKLTWNEKELNFPADLGFLNFFQTHQATYTNVIYIKNKDKFDFFNPELKNAVLLVELNSLKAYDKDFWKDIPCQALVFLVKNYDAMYFTKYQDEGLVLPIPISKTPHLFINKKALGKYTLKSANLVIDLNKSPEKVQTENIIGYIEGSDPKLKKDVIVLSAHYDHVGVENGEVFNGADDNGSGTAALLEMAEALQKAKNEGKGLKRSVLLIAMTGEEMGLLGSSYYAANPVIPLDKTIADLNIDMIGRTTQASEKDTFAVYIIGSNMISDDLHKANETANRTYTKLKLDYEYNSVDHPLKLYFRSDHYNFAKFGIPSIFYFGGFHDDYHQPTDDIEKLNFAKIEQVSRLVFHTCCLLGNKTSRPSLKM
jgi:hypothetical protein